MKIKPFVCEEEEWENAPAAALRMMRMNSHVWWTILLCSAKDALGLFSLLSKRTSTDCYRCFFTVCPTRAASLPVLYAWLDCCWLPLFATDHSEFQLECFFSWERDFEQCQHFCWRLVSMSLSNQVSRDAAAELWLADIQEAVKEANQESQKTLKSESGQGFPAKAYLGQQINTNAVCLFVCLFAVCLAVAAVNQAVKENKVSQTLRVLTMPETRLQGIISACAADYQRELYSLITDRIHTGATHMFSLLHPVKNIPF